MCGKNNVISDEVLELMVEGRYGAAAEKVLDHAEWVSTNAASDDDLEKSDSIAALYPILIGLRLNEELASGHELWNSKKRERREMEKVEIELQGLIREFLDLHKEMHELLKTGLLAERDVYESRDALAEMFSQGNPITNAEMEDHLRILLSSIIPDAPPSHCLHCDRRKALDTGWRGISTKRICWPRTSRTNGKSSHRSGTNLENLGVTKMYIGIAE
ncbi:hypothetical protein [Thiolapillus sp.]|uniref:hypothetical protein n=1 Tax=Thiolapillus sp. TaxID=2017437 RepID=UPI003AF9519D